eukprot:CAMPEP_0185273258 /NCGR_PEP_ID=MMETSP1359-20130426/49092_1 /TAXON_ID=552665 /ORGANISM="Bigelowiella longifila, Strain CCMP242" /LENGTH=188 /DNA_ID=CAMNT_0027865821 /DNA_START=21 /DNA_END=587 /DNA_ORIENTATION=+
MEDAVDMVEGTGNSMIDTERDMARAVERSTTGYSLREEGQSTGGNAGTDARETGVSKSMTGITCESSTERNNATAGTATVDNQAEIAVVATKMSQRTQCQKIERPKPKKMRDPGQDEETMRLRKKNPRTAIGGIRAPLEKDHESVLILVIGKVTEVSDGEAEKGRRSRRAIHKQTCTMCTSFVAQVLE